MPCRLGAGLVVLASLAGDAKGAPNAPAPFTSEGDSTLMAID